MAYGNRTRGTPVAYQKEGVFSVTMSIVNPEVWARFENLHDVFLEYFNPLFKGCVFASHRYLIRVTPIDTGRLRAGWTSILKKYQQDYGREFTDLTLVDSPAIHPLDPSAIAEGENMSSFQDLPLDITIINQVPYGEHMEFGSSTMAGRFFTNRARYKSEHIFTKTLSDWFKECSAADDIVEPKAVEEVTA